MGEGDAQFKFQIITNHSTAKILVIRALRIIFSFHSSQPPPLPPPIRKNTQIRIASHAAKSTSPSPHLPLPPTTPTAQGIDLLLNPNTQLEKEIRRKEKRLQHHNTIVRSWGHSLMPLAIHIPYSSS
jgi:hypothetical protein